ncbi:MAG: imidazoleglycerol-phosphate dehydratase [bacterium]|nr:MAG: imidazoleglycerol-phosphate dehydratase [bacterium]
MSTVVRETRETRVRVNLGLDPLKPAPSRPGARPDVVRGTYAAPAIRTGDRFLDHMLHTLARYANLALDVEATGDLRHHLIEDVAITIGLALRDEIPATCQRYGEATIPMDDALVHAALDAGGRPYYRGPLPVRLYDHFFRSLTDNAGITLHLRVLRGRDRHHIVEAAFKAFGLALRQSLAPGDAVFSTKGAIRLERSPGHRANPDITAAGPSTTSHVAAIGRATTPRAGGEPTLEA